MIRANARWKEFEAQYWRTAYRDMDLLDALSLFDAMWSHARELNPDMVEDWREDEEATIVVARVLNGLPPY